MAHIDTGGRGGRSSNFELNLVPFIDLMSVLITFLLLSAVWTQVSMIQLGASFASPRMDQENPPTPPPLENLVLKLEIREAGYVLFVGKETTSIPKLNNDYDKETLRAALVKVKQAYPDKGGIKLAIEDAIKYDAVVTVMDVGLSAGFSPELLTGGPN